MYTVTNQEASQYSCPDALGNESGAEMGATLGTKLGMAQKGSVLQFTGQQCGYDPWFEIRAAPVSSLNLRLAEENKVL